jgi:hypothetical protein
MRTATIEGASLLESGVVAAVVAGLVSLTTLAASGWRARLDRQRQLFADAFEAIVAYREFAYIVRRRQDHSAGERSRISSELSAVQARIASLEARVRVEAPKVGEAYAALVTRAREVAGQQIRSGWDAPPLPPEATGRIEDVDMSSMNVSDDLYLDAVRAHLAWWRLGR